MTRRTGQQGARLSQPQTTLGMFLSGLPVAGRCG